SVELSGLSSGYYTIKCIVVCYIKYVRIRGIGSTKHYSERQRKWTNSFKPPMMEAMKREVKMNKIINDKGASAAVVPADRKKEAKKEKGRSSSLETW
ncbi:hypothetical protein C0J52_13299, partial [Blattella germanica]